MSGDLERESLLALESEFWLPVLSPEKRLFTDVDLTPPRQEQVSRGLKWNEGLRRSMSTLLRQHFSVKPLRQEPRRRTLTLGAFQCSKPSALEKAVLENRRTLAKVRKVQLKPLIRLKKPALTSTELPKLSHSFVASETLPCIRLIR